MTGVTSEFSRIQDELWQNPSQLPHLAERLLVRLRAQDWLALAAWEVAARYVPAPGRFVPEPDSSLAVVDIQGELALSLTVSLAKLTKPDLPRVEFDGLDFVVSITANYITPTAARLACDPVALIIASQLMRDRMDSLLLLPKQFRDLEIQQMSTRCGLDELHFRRLLKWQGALQRFVEGR